MDNVIINYQPSKSELNKLERWLSKEYQIYGTGFYKNWEVIEDAFENKELVLLNRLDDVIGFVAWGKDNVFSEIKLMEIRKDCRGFGYGKYFYNGIEKLLSSRNMTVIKLHCNPRTSQHFWRKMNFKQFHKGKEYAISDLTFYKPLIEVKELAKNISKNRLELWDLNRPIVDGKPPKWIWNLDEDEKLKKPILHPCSREWKIRLFKNGEKVREDTVQYLTKRGNELYFRDFLFIDTYNVLI